MTEPHHLLLQRVVDSHHADVEKLRIERQEIIDMIKAQEETFVNFRNWLDEYEKACKAYLDKAMQIAEARIVRIAGNT